MFKAINITALHITRFQGKYYVTGIITDKNAIDDNCFNSLKCIFVTLVYGRDYDHT